MIRHLIKAALCCCLTLFVFMPLTLSAEPGPDPAKGMAVRAGKLLTMDEADTVLNHAVVLIRNGRVEALGPEGEVEIPKGYKVIDARDRWVVPGLVDYHSHIGGGLSDLNDPVYLTNPGLRVDECFKPDNERIRDARAGGLTSLLLIPGSSNNMAGFGLMYKSAGRTLEESVLTNPGCIKMSQAGNPEFYWYRVGRCFMTWNLRHTLYILKDYHEGWCAFEEGKAKEAPAFDPAKEPFRDLFRGKYPTCLHTHLYHVCLASFMLFHDEFGFWTVPTHSTFDAYKLAPLAVERGIVVVAGPRNFFLDGRDRRINGVAAKWWEGGLRTVATETDSPVTPIEEHSYQAAVACHYGWEPYAALKGLTLVTAKGGMVEDRVGSIEKGKDGDLGIWTGDPVDPRSVCTMTIVNGRVVYDMKKEGQRY